MRETGGLNSYQTFAYVGCFQQLYQCYFSQEWLHGPFKPLLHHVFIPSVNVCCIDAKNQKMYPNLSHIVSQAEDLCGM